MISPTFALKHTLKSLDQWLIAHRSLRGRIKRPSIRRAFEPLESRDVPAIGIEWENEVPSTDNGLNQQAPDVAMLADGSYFVVWQDSGNIFAREYNARKMPVGNQFAISTKSGTKTYSEPRIAATINEKIVAISYTEYDTADSDEDVWVWIGSLEGPIVSETTINVGGTSADYDHRRSDIAMDDHGRIAVVWECQHSTSGERNVEWTLLGRTPNTGVSVVGADDPSLIERRPAIAMSSDGKRVAVAWEEQALPGGIMSAQATLYDTSSAVLAPTTIRANFRVPLTSVLLASEVNVDVAMDSKGRFAIVWQEDTTGTSIKKRDFLEDGTPVFGSQVELATGTGVRYPRIGLGSVINDYVVTFQGSTSSVSDVRLSYRFNGGVGSHSFYNGIGSQSIPAVSSNGSSSVIVYQERLGSDDDVMQAGLIMDETGKNGNDIVGFTNTGRIWVARDSLGTAANMSNELVSTWSTAVKWRDFQTGDFDGDGKEELIARVEQGGQWWLQDESATAYWGTWSSAVTWQDINVLDFNGDGKDDLVGRTSYGQWWAAISTGSGFTNIPIGWWSSSVTWLDVKVGQFDNDPSGRMDIMGRTAQGFWWLSKSTGTSLVNDYVGFWNPALTWTDVRVGKFDGKNDAIVGRAKEYGQWWIVQTSPSYSTSLWGQWGSAVVWKDVIVGDFNGDGRDDIAGRVGPTGEWWVGVTKPTGGMTNYRWGLWVPTRDWRHVQAADMNGDGRNDIVGWDASSGKWWAAISTGNGFRDHVWGLWSPLINWLFVKVGRFD